MKKIKNEQEITIQFGGESKVLYIGEEANPDELTDEQIAILQQAGAYLADIGITDETTIEENWSIIVSLSPEQRKEKAAGLFSILDELDRSFKGGNATYLPNLSNTLIQTLDWSSDEQVKEVWDVAVFNNTMFNFSV